MDIMTHAKFYFNQLMLTLIFGIWASEPPIGPGKRLKRPGLIGLKWVEWVWLFLEYLDPWSLFLSAIYCQDSSKEID